MALLVGYIYVIADKERKFAKIGMSRDVQVRLRDLQSYCPLPLEIVQAVRCTYARLREAKVHLTLRDLRIHGEWFHWNNERIQTALIEVLAIDDENIKAVISKFTGSYDYPIKRVDTGQTYPSVKKAATALLQELEFSQLHGGTDPKELEKILKICIKEQIVCAGTLWKKIS